MTFVLLQVPLCHLGSGMLEKKAEYNR